MNRTISAAWLQDEFSRSELARMLIDGDLAPIFISRQAEASAKESNSVRRKVGALAAPTRDEVAVVPDAMCMTRGIEKRKVLREYGVVEGLTSLATDPRTLFAAFLAEAEITLEEIQSCGSVMHACFWVEAAPDTAPNVAHHIGDEVLAAGAHVLAERFNDMVLRATEQLSRPLRYSEIASCSEVFSPLQRGDEAAA